MRLFRHLDVRDGMPHSQVNTIHKDSSGNMWFGTASGLARYDGYTFRVFRNNAADDTSIPGNFVEDIEEDCQGRLWVYTDGNQYSIFNPRTETFNNDVRGVLKAMGIDGVPHKVFVDSDKTLWLFIPGEGLVKVVGETPEGTTRSDILPNYSLSAIGECADGLLLVYDNGTLLCVDRQKMTVRWQQQRITDDIGAGSYERFGVYTDSDGDLWVYGSLGTWVYSPKQHRWLTQLYSGIGSRWGMVAAVAQDRQGYIWIGTNKRGLIRLDKQTGSQQQIDNNTINALMADSDGTLWVGTYKKGVAYYNESVYKFSLLLTDDITCIEESDGTLWLGTDDAGLIKYDPSTGRKTTYRHAGANSIASDAVVSLHHSRDGRLWIGTFQGGLDCFDGTSFRHWRSQEGSANALANDNVWAIDEDRDGRLWIGTLGGGVQCLNTRTGAFTTYDMSSSALITNHIASLCVIRDGRIVIGTASCGVAILDPRNNRITTVDSLSCPGINHVFEDSRGLVWIGTRDGLNLYDPRTGKVTIVSPSNDIEHFIAAIAEDDNHNMWITTSNGAMNITVNADEGHGYTFTARTYDHSDGLQANGFNQRSILRLASGEMVMGGIHGINMVNPSSICYNRTPPRVMFTGLYLFDEEVVIGREYNGRILLPEALSYLDELKLKYAQNMFTITFSTDNYIQSSKTTYHYKLEGFNSGYMTAGEGEHSVTYTNLAPGTYTLYVRAINNDGYESTEEAHLRIVIMPPFYLTPWAYIIYILLAAGLMYAIIVFIRYRERNRYKLRQVEEEARKTDELNQMKFRFFTNISHELRTPLTLIISPLEEMMKTAGKTQLPTLEMIHRNASKLLYLVNQLLDFRKNEMAALQLMLSEGDIVGFVRSICDSFLLLSERKNVNLTFYSANKSLTVAFDSDKVGKMVMNLLSNAFKFTPDGGRVDVAVEQTEDSVVIKVSDTGIGIDDEYKERVFERFFRIDETDAAQKARLESAPTAARHTTPTTGSGIGLSLVKEYAEMHGGSVRVLDNVETGSVFAVTLPLRHVTNVTPPAARGDEQQGTTPPAATPPKTQLPLALIVDDNADLVAFMRESLSLFFRIETAADGDEAWQRIPELMPDIVVTDLMMPGMDGYELCRHIKGDSRTGDIPVIVLTAKQRMEDQVDSLRTGADDYVTKPFNIEILTLRMLKLVDLSHKTQRAGLIDPEPSKIEITSLDEKLVKNAIKYVEDNISRSDLSVEELARSMGMSRVHLYKQLLRITGKTPIEFIRVIRLKRAAQMLRESQLNVSEIAYRLGFNNPKYFTKYFRDYFGMLPSVYQEQNGV